MRAYLLILLVAVVGIIGMSMPDWAFSFTGFAAENISQQQGPENCKDGNADGMPDGYRIGADGYKYCMEMITSGVFAGKPGRLYFYAWHEDGIDSISLYSDDNIITGIKYKACKLSKECSVLNTISANYPDRYIIRGTLYTRVKRPVPTVKIINAGCESEYCEPNPAYTDFFSWLRSAGYRECVAGFYLDKLKNHNQSAAVRSMLSKKVNVAQPLAVNFYDIIPDDINATYSPMAEGEGVSCNASEQNPGFCLAPVTADYKFAESHFEGTFGIDFEFAYNQVRINYSQSIGRPQLVRINSTNFYKYPSRSSFAAGFTEPYSILHYAIETLNGIPVHDMTGFLSNKRMEISLEPLDADSARIYAREFGRALGLQELPRNAGSQLELPGIMDSLRRNSSLDVTSPIERYVTAPEDGFLDEATYADRYNSILQPACGNADPAILYGKTAEQNSTETTYELTLTNHGETPTGFFKVAVFDSPASANPAEERLVELIEPGKTMKFNFTILNSRFAGSPVFVLDSENQIAGENAQNNRWPLRKQKRKFFVPSLPDIRAYVSDEMPGNDVEYENDENVILMDEIGRRYAELVGMFSKGNVDIQRLRISVDIGRIAIDTNGTSGVSPMHTLFVENDNSGAGVYVCPLAKDAADVYVGCENETVFTGQFPQTIGGVTVSIDGNEYKIEGLTGSGAGSLPLPDSTGPLVELTAPTPDDYAFAGSNEVITIRASANSAFQRTVARCVLEWNEQNESMTMQGGGSNAVCEKAKSGLEQGLHQYRVFAVDSAGYAGESEIRFLEIVQSQECPPEPELPLCDGILVPLYDESFCIAEYSCESESFDIAAETAESEELTNTDEETITDMPGETAEEEMPAGDAETEVSQEVSTETTCHSCLQPGSWSGCSEGTQQRANYRCGADTGYACEAFTESRECHVAEKTPQEASQINIENMGKLAAAVCAGGLGCRTVSAVTLVADVIGVLDFSIRAVVFLQAGMAYV